MIEAEGLSKFYGSLPAIRDVSFQVKQGEVVGFLGPNGAGKSTTIRILTCFMPPTAGVARIDGLDCLEQSLEVRRKVGYLPENVPLYLDLSVRRFLRFAAGAKGVEAKRMESEIRRVIGICGLEKVAHRIIGHLSKGYKQRVGLAQALLNNPSVLILDEPSIGLDPTQIIEIRRLIRELREEHTILLSSHILPEVAQICQRVLIINKGQIVATDSPAALTSQLQKSSHVSLEIKGEPSGVIASLEALEGVQKVSRDSVNGGRLVVETDRARDLRPEIARVVVDQGADLLELKMVDLSLEDIFMQLVTEESSREEMQS
ncbi:ABC transporter ATP-binding protein [Desulforhabdus amnigena]|jgi:ABC-2 type transport system ATP-binding protein|uniref:Multidrug ABC transporter ATP-binding protein n=1 Tax=Desulforhabdus amnigena TaxID=40218 RepID=A0A9W6D102_9BACT|nr:ATP-binding cassette domain-containing protein [Desulforhabdus amnigena]NLJ29982.1 ATP-binding cassette domain-containing protein [Deltaproteobacteria bacterium]GLI34087.1 multidrug ABC transporter ATP-binding protein [Desulforhabdus amnigena]